MVPSKGSKNISRAEIHSQLTFLLIQVIFLHQVLLYPIV